MKKCVTSEKIQMENESYAILMFEMEKQLHEPSIKLLLVNSDNLKLLSFGFKKNNDSVDTVTMDVTACLKDLIIWVLIHMVNQLTISIGKFRI